MTNEQTQFIVVAEAARTLSVDESTIRRWIHQGDLPAIQLPGGQYRIKRSVVENMLRSGEPS